MQMPHFFKGDHQERDRSVDVFVRFYLCDKLIGYANRTLHKFTMLWPIEAVADASLFPYKEIETFQSHKRYKKMDHRLLTLC